MENKFCNKKVLLRECKRHTAYSVASACSAVLSWGRGVPLSKPGGTPVPAGEVPQSQRVQARTGVPLPARTGAPLLGTGVPLSWEWDTPLGKDLGPETWERTWN